MTDEFELDTRVFHRRTYPDGRAAIWRLGGKGEILEDVPLDTFKTLENNGWVQIEYTEDRIILSAAGAKELRIRQLRDELRALQTRITGIKALLGELEYDATTD